MTEKPIEDARTPESAALIEEKATEIASARENYGFDHYVSLITYALMWAYRLGLAAVSRDPLPPQQEALIEQRMIGHGEGQQHTIDDVNAGRIDDLIAPRLAKLTADLTETQQQRDKLMNEKIRLSLGVGQILGPDYDGVPFETVARELMEKRARLAAVQQLGRYYLIDAREGPFIRAAALDQVLAGAIPQPETEKRS